MFFLERLIAQGSRALGVMIGTLRRGAGHAQGGREGDGDDARHLGRPVPPPLPSPDSIPFAAPAPGAGRRRRPHPLRAPRRD
jgi:hypothetical protein